MPQSEYTACSSMPPPHSQDFPDDSSLNDYVVG